MIQVADVKDADLVHKIMLSAFEEYRHIPVPSSALDEKVSSLEALLRNGSESALLYHHDGDPVASCRFQFDGNALYFSRLSVCPESRGKGIAKMILKWLEQHALDHGKTEMRCRVRMEIPRNIALYESAGFVVTKEEVVTNPNGFPVKTVVMKKQLA